MKFAADAMLGKLAKWLRILGYDTSYQRDIEDTELVMRAREEGRFILTRDTRLIKRLKGGEYLFIRDNAPFDQLVQAVSELGLDLAGDCMLSHCTLCNYPLEAVPRDKVQGLVPEYTLMREKEFYLCHSCGRAYWPGTHKERIIERLGKIKKGRS
jgi:uncharacterized protein with PIN domain